MAPTPPVSRAEQRAAKHSKAKAAMLALRPHVGVLAKLNSRTGVERKHRVRATSLSLDGPNAADLDPDNPIVLTLSKILKTFQGERSGI